MTDHPTPGGPVPAPGGGDPTLPELVMAWGRGWAACRGTPAPTAVPGGFRVEVGRPGHRVRVVLHRHDAAVLDDLGRRLTAPGTWIKVMGSSAELHDALPPHWAMAPVNHLMSAPFGAGVVTPPAPYAVRIDTTGGAVVATVVDSTGSAAASGRLAPAGSYGVVDQVETTPAHRRRGLGTVVMRALADHGARHGLRTGVLVATGDGRGLYESLGWTTRSTVAAAFIPED
ncbi:GNAT family N-acetyltransferase [Micromonospora echinospora]